MLNSSSTCILLLSLLMSFFFNEPATTEIYTLSLHDALPILGRPHSDVAQRPGVRAEGVVLETAQDRKSTRLNSSHQIISYAVFCLKKKKQQPQNQNQKEKQHKNQ